MLRIKNFYRDMGTETIQKNGASSKSQMSRKIFFAVMCFVLLAGVFVGCQRSEIDSIPSGEATLRYQTVPFGNSNAVLDNLKFYTYDDEYNYYFFVLGHINYVPLAYREAVFFNGVTPLTISFSTADVTQTTIRNSVTTASNHSITTRSSINWSNEIGAKASISAKWARFEASYRHSWGGSQGTDITDSRSFSNTYETSLTTTQEWRDTRTFTIGNNNEPAGSYRLALFSTTDVYFVVVTDKARTRIVDAHTVFSARRPQFWEIDFDPVRGGTFGRTASGELLEIPNIDASQLPYIERCTCEWGYWIVTTTPTATTEGKETRTCSLCQRTETRPTLATFDLFESRWINGTGDGNIITLDNNELTINDGANIVITTDGRNTTRRIRINGTVNITLRNVSITRLAANQSPFVLNNDANVTLRLEGANTLAGGTGRAGIQTTNATLRIVGEGSLTTTGGNGGNGGGGFTGHHHSAGVGGGAGIGGSSDGAGGTIIISSGTGTIIAEGGRAGNGGNSGTTGGTGKGGGGAGAGIGGGGGTGGCNCSNRNGHRGGNGGTVTINYGSSVIANGGANGNNGTQGSTSGIFGHGLAGRGGGQGAGIGGGGGGGSEGGGSNGAAGAPAILTDFRLN